MKDDIENVVIIGGGPAGLAAAVYNARANLNPLVLAGSPPGGQLMLTTEVENYPGYDSILGPELIEKFRSHAKKFNVRIMDQNAIKVDFSERPYKTYTSNKTYLSNSVIIATGAKALWLNLPNEQRLRGKGVSACATCDGFFFRNKVVAIVGGGDTAMEEALTLTKFASKVFLLHRRNEFRASKIMQDRVKNHAKIEIFWNTIIGDVIGVQKGGSLVLKTQSIKLKTTTQNLKVDGLFLAIGHKPDTDIFSNKLELDSKGYIITKSRKAFDIVKLLNGYIAEKKQLSVEQLNNTTIQQSDFKFQSMTSVSGVFAAGDCVDYNYRQAGTAVGMGIAAALDVERWLETR